MVDLADLELRIMHPSYCVARWGSIMISRWNGAVREDRVRKTIQQVKDICAAEPRGGGFVVMVGEHTGLPDMSVRNLVSEALTEVSGSLHAAALVIEGTGFRGATARSVASLMFLASKRPIPMRAFSDMAEAAQWTAKTIGDEFALDPLALRDLLKRVSSEHSQHRDSLPARPTRA